MSSEGKRGAGRPPVLGAEHRAVLVELALQRPTATLEELRTAFMARAGMAVSGPTLRKGLAAAGVVRRRGVRGARYADPGGPAQRRYGYQTRHRAEGSAEGYACALTDAEWALAQELFELKRDARGRPPRYERRTMVNACCYVLRTGCAWRQLPKDFPPWRSVYKAFSRWAAQGLFERLHDRFRAQWREREGRANEPSAAVLDSQSTRISPQGGESGYDAAKKVKGRKRHLLVDTLGLLLAVVVSGADVQDRDGALPTVAAGCQKYPSLQKLYVDAAYAGGCAQHLRTAHALAVEVVRHPASRSVGHWSLQQTELFDPLPASTSFFALPKRWIVERSHAWNERSRRLVMHHDRSTHIAASWVWLAEARRLVRNLAFQQA